MNVRHIAVLLLWSLGALSLLTHTTHGLRERSRDRGRPMKMRDEGRPRMSSSDQPSQSRRSQRKQRRSEKPNIILLITDDQDTEMGSLNYMPKLNKYLRGDGALFSSAFVTTPMCCPSRSSLLTGMYVHNHNTYTNNDNCSSVQWQQTHETRNFGTYLSNAGYRTGYFGKYLNQYSGTYVPPGWSEWVALIRNSRFYNYTLNFNGKKIKHYDNYYKDYLTDLIANDSVTFLKQSKQYFPNRPVAMVLSMPAPHGPEDSAPQYQHLFENVTTHRTPSWNYAPNPDKQWILQYTGKMEPIHIAFTDMLQRKRLQTLQSVDDALEKVVLELKRLGELDNTYILYTSDHGYHLGQYGLLKGKAMPYDFDVRVPFLMRGPKIPHGIRVPNIVINLDVAPTLLDIAGIPIPEHMDGRSIMRLFEGLDERGSIVGGQMKRKKAWRDTFMIERGKITHKKLIERERMEARKNNLVSTKEQRLAGECSKAEYQPPCKANQQWECKMDGDGRFRMYKCRHHMKQFETSHGMKTPAAGPVLGEEEGVQDLGGSEPGIPPSQCVCPDGRLGINRREKRLQRQFLKDHVNQPEMLKPRFLRARRQLDKENAADPSSQEDIDDELDTKLDKREEGSFLGHNNKGSHIGPHNSFNRRSRARRRRHRLQLRALERNLQSHRRRVRRQLPNDGVSRNCRVLANQSVSCTNEMEEFDSWKAEKDRLDQMIRMYRDKLDKLKEVRRALKMKRPGIDEDLDIDPAMGTGNHDVMEAEKVPLPVSVEETDPPLPLNPVTMAPMPFEEDAAKALYGEEDVSGDLDLQASKDKNDNNHLYDPLMETTCDCSGSEPLADVYGEAYGSPDDGVLSHQLVYIPRKAKWHPIRSSKFETQEKVDRRKARKLRKKLKQERRERKRDGKGDATRDCSSKMMKCFTHDNTHWKTAPLWNSTKMRKMRGRGARKDAECHMEGLECTRMDNDHWRVAPKWKLGPFCFCPNSNNNTYWCIRTINDTHNFLYCEFITGFISFYDMATDPYQLRNAVHDLSYGVLNQLHYTLEKLRGCKGAKECNVRFRPMEVNGHPSSGPAPEGSGEADGTAGSGEEEDKPQKIEIPKLYEEFDSSGDIDRQPFNPAKEEFLWLTTHLRLDNPRTSGRYGDHLHRHGHGLSHLRQSPIRRVSSRHRPHGHIGPPWA